ncbi:Thiamine pyrophosphokinase [Cercospora zeina]
MATHNGPSGTSTTELRPAQYFGATEKACPRVALIILNCPFDDLEYFKRLYDHASYRLCADGGANRVHDLLRRHYPSSDWTRALQHALPSAIHGDLDSIRDEVRLEYEKLNVPITHDPDQYSTDFGKAINKVVANQPGVTEILVLGGLGGRVDQGLGLLHEIYREQKCLHPSLRFWLFSESNVSVLLRPGTTTIHTPLDEGLLRQSVGLLPLYGKAVISTKGLEWDVQDWETEMGGQVSTSNHIKSDRIVVHTDVHVLFTVERETVPLRPKIWHEETF